MAADQIKILTALAMMSDDQAMNGIPDRMPCFIGCGAIGALRQRVTIHPGGKPVTVALCGPHASLIATNPRGHIRPDLSPKPVDLILPARARRTETP